MKAKLLSLAVTVATVCLLITGCTQASPAPASPTSAPAATKAAAAPAAQPTAVAAPKVDWPAKGRTIQLTVAYAAGGSNDIAARIIAPAIEKVLGTPVEVVNKAGAGGQICWSELAAAKPDGYTISMVNLPAVNLVSLDPDRNKPFSISSFAQLAMATTDPNALAVKADSPYKTTKDLIDAAKANPEKITMANGAIMGSSQIAALQLGQVADAKFAYVNFDGGAPGRTALLGGHVESIIDNASGLLPLLKAGQVRMLGLTGTAESRFFPGVKTFESQGYKVNVGANGGVVAPANTPKEVVDVLTNAIKTGLESPDVKKKFEDAGFDAAYKSPADMTAFWQQMDSSVGPLIELAKKKN